MEDTASMEVKKSNSKKPSTTTSVQKKDEALAIPSTSKDSFAEIKTLVISLKDEVSNLNSKVENLKSEQDKSRCKVPNTEVDRPGHSDEISMTNDSLSLGHITDEENDFGDIQEFDHEYDFDLGLAEEKLGEDIDHDLAEKFSEGMIKNSSWEKSKIIMEKYPRPRNVHSLKTPAVNEELLKAKELKMKIKNKDQMTSNLHDLITSSLTVCANLMSDIKQDRLDRKECYNKLGDVTRLMMDAHKRVSCLRRLQLRPFLNDAFRGVCSSSNIENSDNEWLFGHDLGRAAEDLAKSSRLTAKLTDSAKNGRQRGRGAPTPRGRFSQHRGRGQYSTHPSGRGQYSTYPRGRGQYATYPKRKEQTSFHQQAKFQKKD